MFRLLFAVGAAALITSCSPRPTTTCAETCSGCCDSSGACQGGNDQQACGASGFQCQACMSGTTCNFGTCIVRTTTGGGTGGGTTGGGTGGGGSATGGGGSTGGGGGGGGTTGGGSATGGGGGTTTGGGTGGGTSGMCAGTLRQCSGQCVDTSASLENCGQCGRVCGNGEVCIRSACALLPDDCTTAQCGSGFFCDPVTRKCAPGCRLSTDCPMGATCNTGTCACPAVQHPCGQACVANNAPASCGASCLACVAPANASSTCDGTGCGFACNLGFTQSGQTCVDVNECAAGNGGCDANATCTNTPGSRTCACNAGFMGDGMTCADVNECATSNGGCDANATCNNTPGARTCACNVGYQGSGTTCTDVNECVVNNGGCSVNATCTNTPGARTCMCNSGFTGDGITCSGVNVCTTNNGGCDANATCTPNGSGGRTCACNPGYSGSGITCSDINECNVNNGGCSINATCANTMGGRNCTCNSGYSGNGVVCSMGSRNFALVRVGPAAGGGALTGVATEVHLELRDFATGALVSTTDLPVAASGANQPLTLGGLSTAEGVLNLSSDNAYLLLAGYATTPGNFTTSVSRVVGRIDVSGSTINTTTLITDAFSAVSIRSAASVNGSGYWVAGASSGVRYVVHGAAGTTQDVFASRPNLRATEIISGQLYASTGANPNLDGGSELSRVFGVGTGLPMAPTTSFINFPGVVAANPSTFVLLDRSAVINGLDTMYLAETNGAAAVRRYDFDGTNWNEGATFPVMSGNTYFLTAIAEPGAVTLLTSGSYGVVTWTDFGSSGLQPNGTALVPTPASGTVYRGLVVLP